MFVIGGGSIVDPHPPKRRKAAGAEDVAKRESSPVAEVILDALDRAGARGVEFARLQIHCGMTDDALRSALAGMKTEGLAAGGRRDFWFSAGALREMQAAITARLARLHAEEPLRPFAALNQVLAGAAPAPESRECFRLALDGLRDLGEVVAAGERLRLATHQPQWVGRFAAAREKLLAQCRESGLAAPTVAEWAARTGLAEPDCRRALDALAEAGELILLVQGVYVHPESFSRAREQVKEFLAKNGRMNIAQARDLLGASRKYLLPFLEELDRRRVTVRQGDFRVSGH
jgi:selenocysteine-specific elongation factor